MTGAAFPTADQAYLISFQSTALLLCGGMRLPSAKGPVVLG
ncbi:hypothetical protein [Mycobacterium marinum]|nr:hypothetical protein [Mycobacterium marinum]MDC8980550.1 hypothetical protein [Mycobacterium marinum]